MLRCYSAKKGKMEDEDGDEKSLDERKRPLMCRLKYTCYLLRDQERPIKGTRNHLPTSSQYEWVNERNNACVYYT